MEASTETQRPVHHDRVALDVTVLRLRSCSQPNILAAQCRLRQPRTCLRIEQLAVSSSVFEQRLTPFHVHRTPADTWSVIRQEGFQSYHI